MRKTEYNYYVSAGGKGDTTRWLRDEATGLVTNKVYDEDTEHGTIYEKQNEWSKRYE